MPTKYRKKPVVIEAMQVEFGNNELTEAIMKWAGSNVAFYNYDPEKNGFASAKVRTLEGTMYVSDGDFIIKGVNGEFYPCKPDIFEKTYEKEEA